MPIAYCREASAIAEANGLDEIRAFAECCLTHVNVLAGNLRAALEPGSARSRSSRRAGTSGGRAGRSGASAWPPTPRASGRAASRLCRQALEHGKALNDLRLKVVGWWRTGSTHVQRGDVEAGLRCYEEALGPLTDPVRRRHGPGGAWRTARSRPASANGNGGSDRGGRVVRGVQPPLHAVVLGALAGRGIHQDRGAGASSVARDGDPGHLPGIRLPAPPGSGRAAPRRDPGGRRSVGRRTAARAAVRTLEDVGARNELARALVAQATLRGEAGDRVGRAGSSIALWPCSRSLERSTSPSGSGSPSRAGPRQRGGATDRGTAGRAGVGRTTGR